MDITTFHDHNIFLTPTLLYLLVVDIKNILVEHPILYYLEVGFTTETGVICRGFSDELYHIFCRTTL